MRVAGRRPNHSSSMRDEDDRARHDERPRLTRQSLEQRRAGSTGARSRPGVGGEIDHRDLDQVAAILAQARGGRHQLLDFLDLLVHRVGRRLVAERSRQTTPC